MKRGQAMSLLVLTVGCDHDDDDDDYTPCCWYYCYLRMILHTTLDATVRDQRRPSSRVIDS